MRIRFLTPADLDLSGAPDDGDFYVDSLAGSEQNDGLTAATPKRWLPLPVAAGKKLYLRGGRSYRSSAAPIRDNTTTAHKMTLSGTALSPVQIKSWGGQRARICGDRVISGWQSVTESHGNAWLASSGEQLDHWLAQPWNPVFIGDSMFYPAFWSPNCPENLAEVCRRDFYSIITGAHAHCTESNNQAQPTPVAGDWTTARDTVLAEASSQNMTFAIEDDGTGDEGKKQTTIWIKHPAIATHYGDSAGPIGAVLSFRGNAIPDAANNPYFAYITGYDYARSEIEAKTPVSSTPPYPVSAASFYWRILFHPFDLRQPGQFASIDGTTWRVRGDWMRGESTISAYSKIAELSGDHATFDGVDFGRFSGVNRVQTAEGKAVELDMNNPIQAGLNPQGVSMPSGSIDGFRFDNMRISQVFTPHFTGSLFTQRTPIGQVLLTLRNVEAEEAWSAAFLQGASVGYDIDGMTTRELGKDTINTSTKTGTTEKHLRDVVNIGNASPHGNGITVYQASDRVRVNGYSNFESPRPYTQQQQSSSSPFLPPVDNRITNMFSMGIREVSVSANAALGTDAYLRSDSGFNGCHWDRVLMADGGTIQIFKGAYQYKDKDTGEILSTANNNGGVVSRSSFPSLSDGLVGNTDSWAGVEDGDPVLFRDVVAGGSNSPEDKGGDSDNFVLEARLAWTGAVDESAWRMLTVNDARDGYESCAIGAQRFDWTIPAYDAGNPQPGTPVDLVLSQGWFSNNQQEGKAFSHVLRARPMSLLSLPDGVGDNDKFLLDQGRIVALERLTAASYTIAVDEQPQAKSGGTWSPAGAAKRTTFEIVRVW